MSVQVLDGTPTDLTEAQIDYICHPTVEGYQEPLRLGLWFGITFCLYAYLPLYTNFFSAPHLRKALLILAALALIAKIYEALVFTIDSRSSGIPEWVDKLGPIGGVSLNAFASLFLNLVVSALSIRVTERWLRLLLRFAILETISTFVISTTLTFVGTPLVTNIILAIDHVFIYGFHWVALYVSWRANRLSNNNSIVAYLVFRIVGFLTVIMTILVMNIFFWVITISETIPVSDELQKMVIVYVQNFALMYLAFAAAIFRMKTIREKWMQRTQHSYELNESSSSQKRFTRKGMKELGRNLPRVSKSASGTHMSTTESVPSATAVKSPLPKSPPPRPASGPNGPWNPYVIGLAKERDAKVNDRRSSVSRESSPRSSHQPPSFDTDSPYAKAHTPPVPIIPESTAETIHCPSKATQMAQRHLIAIPGGGKGLRALRSKPASVVRCNTTGSMSSRSKRNIHKSNRLGVTSSSSQQEHDSEEWVSDMSDDTEGPVSAPAYQPAEQSTNMQKEDICGKDYGRILDSGMSDHPLFWTETGHRWSVIPQRPPEEGRPRMNKHSDSTLGAESSV